MKSHSCNTPGESNLNDALWIDKHAAAALIGISSETIRTYRKRYWEDGYQYQRYNSRTIRYHRELILDWVANRSSPECHQRAIEAYLASLPSNKPKTRGRKPN
ncbi:MAG: hypothetical protein CLLPBCKN_004368 [Chroococcidiopsis cubana SAG 39.79]|uniref:hypothetical protein n=1 Tax=Chroococcidiopsis cubana TaxID=171392 RepID=UPI0018F41F52|nr:hypothetical protein [Chroococcidiopsis cubana]MDZ4874972.1 hypothetical protein [Chroococcidiopsis cubana SAG 39.79]